MENTPMSVNETVEVMKQEIMDLKMDIDEQFDSTGSNQITAKKRKTGEKTGTSIIAIAGKDGMVMGSDGRRCNLSGKVVENNFVKAYWLYKDVFLLCSGYVKTVKSIAMRVKLNAEYEGIKLKDMDFFPSHLSELANKIPDKDKEVESCSFIIAGRLQAVDPPKIYHVDLSDESGVLEYSYDKLGNILAMAGSGGTFMVDFSRSRRAFDRLFRIRRDGDREGLKDYVRDAIGEASKKDPYTGGNVNIVSMFNGSDAVYQTAIPLDMENPSSGYGAWMDDTWRPQHMPAEDID